MKSKLIMVSLAVALAAACGSDENGNNSNGNAGTNNNTGTNNGGTNNGGTNNGGTNNGGTNNSGTNNTATNNGGTNNGGTNNTATNNTATNNTSTNNTSTNNTTNNSSGNINIRVSSMAPNFGPVGTEVTMEFELTNFTFNHDAIGMDHVDGEGHYHVFLDQEDADHELIVSGMNPGVFNVELENVEVTVGNHDIIVRVHKNDHTEFQNPIVFNVQNQDGVGFEVTE